VLFDDHEIETPIGWRRLPRDGDWMVLSSVRTTLGPSDEVAINGTLMRATRRGRSHQPPHQVTVSTPLSNVCELRVRRSARPLGWLALALAAPTAGVFAVAANTEGGTFHQMAPSLGAGAVGLAALGVGALVWSTVDNGTPLIDGQCDHEEADRDP
jgi:hypothetical protein